MRQRDFSRSLFRLGVAIILATIPIRISGLSLSHVFNACGSTLTDALFLNFKREAAARFSFRLGFPAVALAGLKELLVWSHLHMPLEIRILLIFSLVVASISAASQRSGA